MISGAVAAEILDQARHKNDAPGCNGDLTWDMHRLISRPAKWAAGFKLSVPRMAAGVNVYMYALGLAARPPRRQMLSSTPPITSPLEPQ